jgi:membrane protein YqaA with SNARE-associated domain
MKSFFNFSVTLTWSKIMALIIIALAFVIDILADKSGTVFMYSIPFVVFLITGKQFIDSKK